jgi:TctA family transporter
VPPYRSRYLEHFVFIGSATERRFWAELQLRRALQLANGDVTTLVSTPCRYLLIAALLLLPLARRRHMERLSECQQSHFHDA